MYIYIPLNFGRVSSVNILNARLHTRERSLKSCMFHCYIVIDDDGELFLLHEGKKKRTQNSNILGFPQKKRARGAPLDTL